MKRLFSLLAVLLTVGSAAAQSGPWPAAVSNAGITWESSSGEVLLYGGMRDRGAHSDSSLWSWNGARWLALGDGAPGARSGLLLINDDKRRRVLLHGGQNRTAQFDDTWEWKEGRWTRLSVTGPGARHMTAGAFDPVRDQLILFGGYSVEQNAMLGDTWAWDGAGWRKAAEEGPSARAGHVIGFDPARQTVILMGGADAQGRPFTDTWSWDGTRWTRVTDGPTITPNTQLVSLPGGGLGTFGGWDGSRPSRAFFQWDGSGWRADDDPGGPSARMETGMAFDARRGRVVLFGGSDGGGAKLSDLWEYDRSGWRAVNPAP